jgi:hypothetical protein
MFGPLKENLRGRKRACNGVKDVASITTEHFLRRWDQKAHEPLQNMRSKKNEYVRK